MYLSLARLPACLQARCQHRAGNKTMHDKDNRCENHLTFCEPECFAFEFKSSRASEPIYIHFAYFSTGESLTKTKNKKKNKKRNESESGGQVKRSAPSESSFVLVATNGQQFEADSVPSESRAWPAT